MCAVCNMAVFCISLISCFPGILFSYFPNAFETVPVACIISGTILVFMLLLLLLLLTDIITVIHLVKSCLFVVQKLREKAYITSRKRKKMANTRGIKTVFCWQFRDPRFQWPEVRRNFVYRSSIIRRESEGNPVFCWNIRSSRMYSTEVGNFFMHSSPRICLRIWGKRLPDMLLFVACNLLGCFTACGV
jgi:hypothetical protein